MRIGALLAAAAVGVIGLPLGPVVLPAALASAPPKNWFVAQSGTASFGNGVSCTTPDVVGTDDTAIRTVLTALSSDDTVTICNGLYSISNTLIVDDSITIQGQSTVGAILDGGSAVQIMRIDDTVFDSSSVPEVQVTVTDLTFQNGLATEGGTDRCNTKSQCGGAIYVEDESSLTVRRSSFIGNRSSFIGGAIANGGEANYSGGAIRVFDSTFVRNRAGFDGGAIGMGFNFTSGLEVANSTFVENRAESRQGGAISESFSTGTITASTFVNNVGPDGNAIRGSFTTTGSIIAGQTGSLCGSGTTNLNSTNVATASGCGTSTVVTYTSLNLRGLGSWGGPTQTVWLGPGSSAVNANTGACQSLDQRGANRSAAPCDAGAFERQGASDEVTTGVLSYPSSLLVDDTSMPTSSPAFGGGGRTTGYSSLSTSVCSVEDTGGLVVALSAGTCTAQWYLAPTLALDGAAQDDTIVVSRSTQAPLVIDAIPQPIPYGQSVPLTASGGTGSGLVFFSEGSSTGCVVYGFNDLFVYDVAGTCSVTATKDGGTRYEPVTSAPVAVAMTRAPQEPLTIEAPASLSIGSGVVLGTAGGSTGAAVTYEVSPSSVCIVDGDTLRMLADGTCQVSATMAGDTNFLAVSAPTVTVLSAAPAPPDPTKAPSAPRDPVARVTSGSVQVTWTAPASSGPFPISHYLAQSSPPGGTCLVQVSETSCQVTGLKRGTSYTFTVRALSGGGWSPPSGGSNAVVLPAGAASIVITGSREGARIAVAGTARGIGMGGLVTPWTSRSLEDFVSREAIPVSVDGTFSWSRRASSAVVWRVYFTAEGARSNTVTIR
jgi:hypothetical protein